MLHGEIKVNDVVIGEWEAVRQSIDGFEVNDYRCNLWYRNSEGWPMRASWVLEDHSYRRGAAVLAARVIAEGIERLEPIPMDSDEEAVHLMGIMLGSD